MRTLVEYLDAAKEKTGMSDLELGFRIGYKSLVVYQLRKGQRTINEDAMMRLADIAGISREEAALDLAIWRAKGTEAAPVYERMAAMLRGVVLSAAFLVVTYAAPAPAADFRQETPVIKSSLYIMEYIL